MHIKCQTKHYIIFNQWNRLTFDAFKLQTSDNKSLELLPNKTKTVIN